MEKKDVITVINILKNYYPDAKCSLNFSTPFELLVAVMLSAQCTDERVNKTTPNIFKNYSTPKDFNNIELSVLENLIHPCGFYKVKAKNIKNTSKILVDKFNGKVPNTIEELVLLPGIGRKSANVIMLEAFNSPQGIAVDTHCRRISYRLGLSFEYRPERVEQDLLKQIPKEYYRDINHIFMWHGRSICTARNPKCSICPISKFCRFQYIFSTY